MIALFPLASSRFGTLAEFCTVAESASFGSLADLQKQVNIALNRNQNHAGLMSQSLRATIGRKTTDPFFTLRHWNLRNLTLQQECYLTSTRGFFRNTHGSIMLPPRQPRVFARLGSLAISTPSRIPTEQAYLVSIYTESIKYALRTANCVLLTKYKRGLNITDWT